MLSYLETLLNGGDFYPFEKRILSEVLACFDEAVRERLRLQIGVINKVQRTESGRVVGFYQMRGGKANFDDSLRFRSMPPELLLASIDVALSDRNEKLKVDLWMAEGRLFSLEFDRPPKQFFSGVNLKEAPIEIVDVKIHCDLK